MKIQTHKFTWNVCGHINTWQIQQVRSRLDTNELKNSRSSWRKAIWCSNLVARRQLCVKDSRCARDTGMRDAVRTRRIHEVYSLGQGMWARQTTAHKYAMISVVQEHGGGDHGRVRLYHLVSWHQQVGAARKVDHADGQSFYTVWSRANEWSFSTEPSLPAQAEITPSGPCSWPL